MVWCRAGLRSDFLLRLREASAERGHFTPTFFTSNKHSKNAEPTEGSSAKLNPYERYNVLCRRALFQSFYFGRVKFMISDSALC